MQLPMILNRSHLSCWRPSQHSALKNMPQWQSDMNHSFSCCIRTEGLSRVLYSHLKF